MEEVTVVIVGAGPAGIATSACLNRLSIPNVVLERDDLKAPLWHKRTYDRLKLHLGKEFCQLPFMPFPSNFPTFVPRIAFLRYLDNYVSHFNVTIKCNRLVECASLIDHHKWEIVVKDTSWNKSEVYRCKYVVVASGENSEGCVPKIHGLDRFKGEYMHCSRYLNGRELYDKNVLVVGCGNSGMEIAYDLTNWGANTSLVVRNPVHVLSKEMVYIGMQMLKRVPVKTVDKVIVFMSRLRYGRINKYGFSRPKEGPFALKAATGRSPTIDVGCMARIKEGQVKVFPSITSIDNKRVEFDDGRAEEFDVIIFATGYKSTVLKWLKDYKQLFKENGMPKQRYPDHWKGQNGLYCAGFSSRGLMGISEDAQCIANDIHLALNNNNYNETHHAAKDVRNLNCDEESVSSDPLGTCKLIKVEFTMAATSQDEPPKVKSHP
ncbi:putative indole-3-pyruvate monooxygenase YUCCA11 [Senna tora]|uniref:Flavin-containing monooxygenase n=1 Tax=Senna tora TaxID=362788 RepID=A0A834U077_9FABA|nr:putative indole-3-pyruvate monooxygenase YUCCA11 [Senna tora]